MQPADVREELADLDAALAVRRELERRRHAGPPRLRRWARSRSACGPLAVVLRERRLGVERVDVRRPAVHEQEDDPLRPRPGSAAAWGPAGSTATAARAARGRVGQQARRRPGRSPGPGPRSRRRSGRACRAGTVRGRMRSRSACSSWPASVAAAGCVRAVEPEPDPRFNRRNANSLAASSTWAYCSQRVRSPVGRSGRRPGSAQEAQAQLQLRARSRAGRRAAGRRRRMRLGVVARRAPVRQPAGECPGRLDHELAVQHEQLLERHGRLDPAAAGDVRVGEVEEAEQRVEVVAADGRVAGPAAIGRARRGRSTGRRRSGRAGRRRRASRRARPRPRAAGGSSARAGRCPGRPRGLGRRTGCPAGRWPRA